MTTTVNPEAMTHLIAVYPDGAAAPDVWMPGDRPAQDPAFAGPYPLILAMPPDTEATVIVPTAGGSIAGIRVLLESTGFKCTGGNTDAQSWITASDQILGRTAYIGFTDLLGEDPLIGPAIPAGSLAICERLAEWHNAFGTHYRYTPGVSLTAFMRTRQGHAGWPKWLLRERGPGGRLDDWQPPAQLRDVRYQTPRHPKLSGHRWDMRRAYLNAAAAADLPTRMPEPTGIAPQGPGYIRLRADTVNPAALPFLPKPDRHGCIWVGSMTAQVLAELAIYQHGLVRVATEIVDSVTAPGTRHLRPWAEAIRDAQDSMSADLVPVVKNGYASAIGLLNVPRGGVYRPDWRHLIVDYVAGSMLRRIFRVHKLMDGLMPSKVDIDSIWYHTNDPEHVGAALGEGPRMGNLRYEGVQ